MSSRCFCVAFAFLTLSFSSQAAGLAEHIVVLVWDGMRPDFVTPELTPTLWQLRTNGVWFDRHHSAYPSTTEVNGTALATGVYPRNSGVLANLEFRPEINPTNSINTENIKVIRKGDELTDNHYLALPTLAEMLHQKDIPTAIAGSKPVAALHDRFDRPAGDPPGLLLFATNTLPAALWRTLTNRFGAPPAATNPNFLRDEWTTLCLIEGMWERGVPKFSLLWFSEPDTTQHQRGPGSAGARDAIRGCDRNLALVLAELERRGLRAKTDVIVVSDHGFSTINEFNNVAAVLRRAGLNAARSWKEPPVDGDVMVVGTGGTVLLYVIGHNPDVIQKVARTLQRSVRAGVIFSREELPGTFPINEVRLDAEHAPDILVSLRWQPGLNRYGAPGLAVSDGTSTRPGGGMHGSLGPTDMHNTCVANGPDFRVGVTNSMSSGNVDITPTLLWLLNLEPATPRDGRVLIEALNTPNAPPPRIEQRKLEARVSLPDGTWAQYLSITEVDGVRYFDEGNGQFTTNTAAISNP